MHRLLQADPRRVKAEMFLRDMTLSKFAKTHGYKTSIVHMAFRLHVGTGILPRGKVSKAIMADLANWLWGEEAANG